MMDAIEKIKDFWPEWTIEGPLGRGSYGKVYSASRSDAGKKYYSAIKVMTIPSGEEEIEQVFDNFELESEENTTIDGLYAKKYVYTASLGGFDYRFLQAAAIKGTSVYLFTYASTAENYEAHLDDVNSMLGYLLLK